MPQNEFWVFRIKHVYGDSKIISVILKTTADKELNGFSQSSIRLVPNPLLSSHITDLISKLS